MERRSLAKAPLAGACLLLAAVPAAPAPLQAPACPVAALEDELEPSQPVKDGSYGLFVALSGDSLAVSAPAETVGSVVEAGAAYVLTHVGPSWVEQARLTSNAPRTGDMFGIGLAHDRDTVAVGAPFADQNGLGDGDVTVFVRSGSVFTEEVVLGEPSGQTGAGFGWSVALDGDRMAIGAPYFDNGAGPASGAVFVYVRTAGTWALDGTLTASDSEQGDWFGYSVDIDTATATVGVGAYGKGGSSQGAAYVYRRNAQGWVEQDKFTPVPYVGQRLFGYAVTLEGDLLFVGAPGSGPQSLLPGSVSVFTRAANVWAKTAEIFASDMERLDFFGGNLDAQVTRLLVGARDHGRAYLYVPVGGAWVERLKITTEEHGAERFDGVAIQAASLILGSASDDLPGAVNAGVTRTLTVTTGVDPTTNYCTPGTSASGCQAQISACGNPSATSTGGFALIASSVEGSKDGLFYFGFTGQQAVPWGNGTSLQCVVPPIRRCGLVLGSGTNGACDGQVIQDLNALWCPVCPKPQKNPGAGATVQAQFWYRDPQSTSNQSTSLSDALEFDVGP
jgi:hypothetical protein